MKNNTKIIAAALFTLIGFAAFGQKIYQVKGALIESDSVSRQPIPFAYVINLNTHNGVVTDMNGRFVIAAGENDSLQFSCVGFEKAVIKVKNIPDENDSVKIFKRFYLPRKVYELAAVYINKIKIKPNEREYMKRVINRPKVTGIDVATSPITALWQSFSKKGKEMQKLEALFTDLLRKEEIEKKLNTEILRKLVGDENITLEKFRIMCPEISDDFILSTEGYELYSTVSDAYRLAKRGTK